MAQSDIEINVEATGVSAYERDMARASRATTQATGQMNTGFGRVQSSMGSAFGGIGKMIAGAGLAFVAAEVLNLGKSAAQSAIAYETLSVQFGVFLGSAEKATDVLANLNKFSIETPFTPDQVNAAGRSLLAFGFTAEQLIPTMKMVGDVSAAVGKDFNELSTIYGKARTAGTLYAEDINQLTEAGIPIIEELSKVMGVQADEVKKLGSQGKLHFSDLEKAFANMTGEGGRFNGMMDKMSTSTAGLLSTIEGKLQDELRAIGLAMLPTIKTIAEGFEPAFKSLKEAFVAIFTPMMDAYKGFGDLISVFGFGGKEGNKFADIIGVVANVMKFISLRAMLVWKGVSFVIKGFAGAVSGIKDFVSNSPILMGAIDKLLIPFRMLGDAIGWVGDKLGIGGGGTITAMEQYTATMKYAGEEVLKLGQANGLTIPEIQGFTKQIDLSRYAGLSQAEATVRMAGDMRNYALVARATAAATGGVTDSVDKLSGAMAKAAGPAAGSIDALNAKLSELKKAFTATSSDAQRAGLTLQIAELERQIKRMFGDLDPANKGLSSMTKRFSDIAMAAGSAKNELADVMAASEAAGQPDFSSGLAIAQKRLEDRAEAIKDIFKSLSDGIKSMAIDMGYTISEAIGYAITAGGGFGDAIKAVLREMAVQIPKMAGMALLNAATFPGNSAIALPLTIAGAALLGLSGILSGVFKGADAKKQQEQQSIANNSGASSVPRAAQSGLAAFVDNQQNVGQQVVDALNGTQLTLQVGEKSMDAYVKGANKRNATREGK
jgi:tape measure domain-containing protein